MLEEMKQQQFQKQKQIVDQKNTFIRDHARLELDILELESKSLANQAALEKEQQELDEIEQKINEQTLQFDEVESRVLCIS